MPEYNSRLDYASLAGTITSVTKPSPCSRMQTKALHQTDEQIGIRRNIHHYGVQARHHVKITYHYEKSKFASRSQPVTRMPPTVLILYAHNKHNWYRLDEELFPHGIP